MIDRSLNKIIVDSFISVTCNYYDHDDDDYVDKEKPIVKHSFGNNNNLEN